MKPLVRKALATDAQQIHELLIPYSKEGIVLPRPTSEILQQIDLFYVIEEKGKICGVVAYYDYGKHLKEIRSLAVAKSCKGKGYGRLIIETIMSDLLSVHPKPKIFTLTYIPDFFRTFGFTVVDKNTLPEKIWKDCLKCAKYENCDEIALVFTGKNKK